jgi:hypothetical protein
MDSEESARREQRMELIEIPLHMLNQFAMMPDSEILAFIRDEYQKTKKRKEITILLC